MEPISMAAMAALALMTTKMNNAAQAKAQKSNADMAAAQTRYSPYTDMGKGSFQALPQQSELGGAVQGAVAGLNLSQSYAKAESEKAMMDRMNMGMDQGQLQQYNTGLGQQTSPWTMNYNNQKNFSPIG